MCCTDHLQTQNNVSTAQSDCVSENSTVQYKYSNVCVCGEQKK
jgi:hypothetical protein